jgi:hypothetical protein
MFAIFLDKLIDAQLINNFSDFIEPEIYCINQKSESLGQSEG